MEEYTFSHIMSTMATSGIVGMLIGWLLSGSRQAKENNSPEHGAVLPTTDFDMPCPPCKPPRPETPSMAEMAREEADQQIELYCAERLPKLLDSAFDAINAAKAEGEMDCRMKHGLSLSRKDNRLEERLSQILEENGFNTVLHQPVRQFGDIDVKQGEMLICW